ncbi:MAG: DUF4440 domain-containing protein [Rhodospirillaceae bacterium]|nr:DUF4440 domain-containing protein [Rhodospirillaceae bacterium]
MTEEDTAPLVDIVKAWTQAWGACAPAKVIALWDNTDAESWYLDAGHANSAMGPAVKGVIERKCARLHSLDYRPVNPHLRRLGPDLGMAFFQLRWREQRDGHSLPLGGTLRVTMMMRRLSEGWRVFHYAEAPLAPLLELQGYYEKIATEGFAGMPRREGGS